MTEKKFLTKENTAGAMILAAGLFCAIFYIFTRERAEFNLDYTDTLLWAEASVKSGSLISPDFWYAYIIPFSGSIIMMPLIKLFGVTYFTHELGMSLFVLIFAAAMFFCIKTAGTGFSGAASVTGLFLLIISGSPVTRMIFYGHVIHYSLAMLFTFTAVILLNKIDPGKRPDKKSLCCYIILLIWVFLCCLNGSSALLLFLFPLAGALILERVLDPEEITLKKIKWPLILLALLLMAALAGACFKAFILRGYDNSYEDNFSSFLGHDQWMWKEQSFLLRFVTLLTGWVSDNTPMLTIDGLFILLRYLTAVLILIIPVFALISYKKIENRIMRLLILDYWVLFILTMFIYSVSHVQGENWRLCALLGMAATVSLSYLFLIFKEPFIKRFAVILLFTFLISSLSDLITVLKLPSEYGLNGYDRIADVLTENGLKRGYAGLWNGANVITVLSDSRVRVSAIYISDDGGYSIHKYQGEADWYEDLEDNEKYFVILDPSEMEKAKDTLVKNAISRIEFEDSQTILIFDRNIFKDGEAVF